MNMVKPVPSAGKLLVIDDNPIIQRAVYFALRDSGYQVLMVGDVSAATKMLRQEKFDLVLIDLSFPLDVTDIGGMRQDGFYLINWINRTPGIARPPMVIISSTHPDQYRERAAAAGVRACLQKPLSKESLIATVKTVLGTETSGQPAQP